MGPSQWFLPAQWLVVLTLGNFENSRVRQHPDGSHEDKRHLTSWFQIGKENSPSCSPSTSFQASTQGLEVPYPVRNEPHCDLQDTLKGSEWAGLGI